VKKLSETVLHESAALYRFIDCIVRRCADIHEYPVYTKTSRDFLNHIERLGDETKSFLEQFPSSVGRRRETATSKRRKLHTLRASWEVLHEYLEPALDADTLRLPTPLISAIQDEAHKVEGLRALNFTLFHSDEVNYLQVPSGIVKETADSIAALVHGTRFPPNLGLIGMPYSQSSAFFLNCLLTHEMAHVAYQEFYEVEVSVEIDAVLQALVDETTGMSDRDIISARGLLERWVEEVFCDLFAICLIGPAYSFSLIELTGATLLAGSTVLMQDPFHSFVEYHPAEVARFRAHLRLLKKLGWWDEWRNVRACHVEVLEASEERSSSLRIEADIPRSIGEAGFKKAFFRLCEWLMEYVAGKVRASASAIPAFLRQSPVISEYLSRAIVPSTIVVRGRLEYPTAIVLINSFFRFYLEGIPRLIGNVEEREPKPVVRAHSEFVERLELWALKALEDCRLLSQVVG